MTDLILIWEKYCFSFGAVVLYCMALVFVFNVH